MSFPENSVTITRWQSEYRIPRHHPAPQDLKGRLDDTVARLQRDALDAALLPLVSAEGESIWLVRRLEMVLAANTAWDPDRTAAAWAGQITRQLDRTLQTGPDGENVLHFPDWAAYLAFFLGELLDGQAWGRWYFQAFDGLRPLPFSAVARTAILDAPSGGFQALLRLAPGRLKRLVEALTARDARRILDDLAASGPAAPDLAGLIVSACEQVGHAALAEDPFALLVFLEVGRRLGHAAGPGAAAAARAAAQARQAMAGGAGLRLTQALLAAAGGRLADLYALAGPDGAERLAPLAAFSPEQISLLLAALAGGPPPVASDPAASRPRRNTPFGGAFLLLPELERLPLARMLADFPAVEGEDSQAALRLLLLVRAGGRSRAVLHFADPLLRDLAGVSPRFTPASASAWLNRVRPQAWEQFCQALVGLDQEGQHSELGLAQARLAGRSAVALVNTRDGAWLALAGLDPRRQSHWQSLRPWLEANPAVPWLGDPVLLDDARRTLQLSAPPVPDGDSEVPAQGAAAARLAQVTEDLHFLLAPSDWRAGRKADLALALAAQRLLRRFSRALGGFQQSGLPYLFANFLDFTAGLDEEPGRHTVTLGRPPLALVLQRAGQMRQSYRLGWGDGRSFELYPET